MTFDNAGEIAVIIGWVCMTIILYLTYAKCYSDLRQADRDILNLELQLRTSRQRETAYLEAANLLQSKIVSEPTDGLIAQQEKDQTDLEF